MAYINQTYNTYFFESHEEHERMFRERYRKGEQQKNREIQAIIAEDLSQLASAEYRDDILKHMEQMEVRSPILMILFLINLFSSSTHFLMSHLLRFRRRYNGLCDHILLTS